MCTPQQTLAAFVPAPLFALRPRLRSAPRSPPRRASLPQPPHHFRMSLPVTNPATGQPDYFLSEDTPAQVSAAAALARSAAPAWRALSFAQRGAHLARLRDLLDTHRAPLLAALTTDTGGGISAIELEGVRGTLKQWAALAADQLSPSSRPSIREGYALRTTYRPYELVAALAPWNVPLFLLFIDAIPALMAGCAVLLKPSEITPRFVEPLRDILARLDPPFRDVVLVVVGGAQTGAAVVDQADLVCFTGGVKVGRIVAKRCAERMIPVFLELGGKDPVIVDASADLDTASSAVVWAALINTGQNCFSVERVYVHEDVHDEFVGMVVEKTAEVARKDVLRPMISKQQAEIIRLQLEDAREKGAKIEVGGDVVVDKQGGTWVQATVVSGVNHDMILMTEETFGPVIPVMKFRTREEAVELANDSVYGLSGAVFALPAASAIEIGDQMNVGLLGINEAGVTALGTDAEKSAFGLSGVSNSSRLGNRSIMRFVRTCSQVVKEDPLRPNPSWFNAVERHAEKTEAKE